MVVEGLMNVFSDPLVILFIAIGVIVVGIIFGSIPGLTATMAIVMFLPVTYTMTSTQRYFNVNCIIYRRYFWRF